MRTIFVKPIEMVKFHDFARAIRLLDKIALEKYFKLYNDTLNDPHRLQIVEIIHPETNENILHLAGELTNKDIFTYILVQLTPADKILLARSASSNAYFEIEDNEDHVEREEYLPSDAISVNLRPDEIKEFMEEKLQQLVLHEQFRPMHALIDEKEIEARYPGLDEKSDLYKNVLHAVQLINKVRALKLTAITHPDYATQTKGKDKLNTDSDNRRKYSAPIDAKLTDNELENATLIYESIVQTKDRPVGCQEIAAIGAVLSNGKARVFQLVNGDHVFLVIGKNPGNDYTKWHNAVLCDPLNGTFCRFNLNELRNNLFGFRCTRNAAEDREYITSIFFNPDFHVIAPFNLNNNSKLNSHPKPPYEIKLQAQAAKRKQAPDTKAPAPTLTTIQSIWNFFGMHASTATVDKMKQHDGDKHLRAKSLMQGGQNTMRPPFYNK